LEANKGRSKSRSDRGSPVTRGIAAQGEHGVDVQIHLIQSQAAIAEVTLAVKCCAQTVEVVDLTMERKDLLQVRHIG
jgi:hypothetical protein